jgi:hypothetical protein
VYPKVIFSEYIEIFGVVQERHEGWREGKIAMAQRRKEMVLAVKTWGVHSKTGR